MISAVLLCGGGGRRFGGTDKPLVELGGRPLVAHVLERLAPQVDEIVVSANRSHDRYRAFGWPVVADEAPDAGPLGGVAAALPLTTGPRVFLCPGDCPLLPVDLVARLERSLEGAGATVDAALPHDGVRDQPLFLLVRRRAAMTVGAYLATGSRSVHGWVRGLNVVRCPVQDPEGFVNVNTPADLKRLDARWQSAGR